jgi:hypothetical protein
VFENPASQHQRASRNCAQEVEGTRPCQSVPQNHGTEVNLGDLGPRQGASRFPESSPLGPTAAQLLPENTFNNEDVPTTEDNLGTDQMELQPDSTSIINNAQQGGVTSKDGGVDTINPVSHIYMSSPLDTHNICVGK